MLALETTVLADGFSFLEGACWRHSRLWFSDIVANKVYSMDDSGAVVIEREMTAPSGLGWLPDGRLLAASFADAHVYIDGPSGMERFADLSDGGTASLNDMIVLPSGSALCDRYYYTPDVISANFPDESSWPKGEIVLLAPDGSHSVVATDVKYPNAFALAPDGRTLLVALTGGGGIGAFDLEPDGSLLNRRMWATVPDRFCDGMCLDAEGAVWVGSFYTCEFLRVREGGEITHRIDTGERWAVFPRLGGADGKTLFLLTADTTLERVAAGDSSGRVEVVRVEVPSAGWS